MPSFSPSIKARHHAACQAGNAGYIDPTSGLMVLTAQTLLEQGTCCGSGCRHCPYSAEEQQRSGRPSSSPK